MIVTIILFLLFNAAMDKGGFPGNGMPPFRIISVFSYNACKIESLPKKSQ